MADRGLILAAAFGGGSGGSGGGGITPEGTKEIEITENGTVTEDVTEYAEVYVTVDVPTYPEPSGVIDVAITENGETELDVKDYATAKVTVDVSSGGGEDTLAGLIEGTLTELVDTEAVRVRDYCFYNNQKLRTVSLTEAKIIGNYAFQNCTNVNSVNIPKVTEIGSWAFAGIDEYVHLDLPEVVKIGSSAFRQGSRRSLNYIYAPKLEELGDSAFVGYATWTYLKFDSLKTIGASAFQSNSVKVFDMLGGGKLNGAPFANCADLEVIVIRSDTMTTLAVANAFSSNKIGTGNGYIFVPDAMVNTYKQASNWSQYADQIRPLSEYNIDDYFPEGV